MKEVTQQTTERAILVALQTGNIERYVIEEHLNELEELANTAGAETIIKIVQERHSPDPAFYIGKGKADEIKSLVELNNIQLVIFDDDLSAVQVRNLERLIDKKIIDRSGLILDIFASRAKTKEAKTQVELAQLQYMLPRLTRAWTHLSKQFGGIGTKGPGETQIETDRRIIRYRIGQLKEKLQTIEQSRKTQNIGRANIVRISLVGYTNAGKSTLFNLLTSAKVFAEDKLFATLDSTTRAFNYSKSKKAIISDTVGFIRKLPHHLVASFKSTLAEVQDADIIFHVVDISHPYFEDHIEVVRSTLKDLQADTKPTILILNKIDLVTDKVKIDFLRNKYKHAVLISAERAINITTLKNKMADLIEEDYLSISIKIPLTEQKLISKVYELAEVSRIRYTSKSAIIYIKTSKENFEKLNKIIYAK